ncbi:MAG TPA: VanZ family protein [Ardenticatenaceae bacterium]|nr:VanZ family protein [Ardenticatenaceae bacterium]
MIREATRDGNRVRRPSSVVRLLAPWAPAVVCMIVIFWLSSQPDLPGPPGRLLNLLLKKGAHLTIYALLTLLYRSALVLTWAGGGTSRVSGRYDLVSMALSTLYAISDEWHQRLTPGRQPRLLDVLIDVAGACLALILWHLAQRFHHRLDQDRRE